MRKAGFENPQQPRPSESNGMCRLCAVSSCKCPPGFEGPSCQTNTDDCEDHDCENGATCVDGVNNYTCFCPPYYTG